MAADPQTFFAVHITATGEITRSGSCRSSKVSAQAIYSGEAALAVGQMVTDASDWVNSGLVEQRPGLPDVPASQALATGADWDIAGIPAGSEVWIDGSLVGVLDASGLTLSFPMAATWQLRIVPPFPFKPADCEVVTT